MAIRSSILAWEIPWTEGPGRLQSMGPQRITHKLARLHYYFGLQYHLLFSPLHPVEIHIYIYVCIYTLGMWLCIILNVE